MPHVALSLRDGDFTVACLRSLDTYIRNVLSITVQLFRLNVQQHVKEKDINKGKKLCFVKLTVLANV